MYFVLNPLYIGISLIFVKFNNYSEIFPVKQNVDTLAVQI